MRMLETGTSIDAVIFEDGDVGDAMIHAQGVIPQLVGIQNAGHLLVAQQCHAAGVIRTIDNDFVESESVDAPAEMLETAHGLNLYSAANLFGMTRTFHGSAFAGN